MDDEHWRALAALVAAIVLLYQFNQFFPPSPAWPWLAPGTKWGR